MDPRAKELIDKLLDYSLDVGKNGNLSVRIPDRFKDFEQLFIDGAKKRDIKIEIDFDNFYEDIGIIHSFAPNTGMSNYLLVPCKENAEEIGMQFKDWEDLVYNVSLIDWKKASIEMAAIKERFDNAKDVHIIVPGKTDIRFSLNGRLGQIDDGKINLPGGEVCYCPVEESIEGQIYFPYKYPSIDSSIFFGEIVSGLMLKLKGGKVVDFSAETGEYIMDSVLRRKDMDLIGEFGIGCNKNLYCCVNNPLLDEKINGTIHLAIGHPVNNDIHNGGGLGNDADLHYDLICELKKLDGSANGYKNPGGEIWIDGYLMQKDGKWNFPLND